LTANGGEADGDAVTFEDLLGQLDATAAAGREADAIRPDKDPRIPKLEHMLSYEWRPPPSRDQVLQTVDAAACCRRFDGTGKKSGDLFRKEGILKHYKDFGIWDVARVCNAVPERSIKNPHGRPGLTRYHQQSEAFEEPHDKQLHYQHRDWLKGHYAQREKHLHPVYHALKKVEHLEERAKEVQQQRETTRDAMTRTQLHKPDFSQEVKAKLCKAKMSIAASRQFNKLSGIDTVAEAEKKKKDAVSRARSVPILELKPATPRHRARHLRSWKGPDRRKAWVQTDSRFVHTTPGAAQEEERELHNSPRYRARGA